MWLLLGVVQHRQAVIGQLQMCRSCQIPNTTGAFGFGELVVEGLRLHLFDNAGGCCATLLSCVLAVANIPLDIQRENGDFFGVDELEIEELSFCYSVNAGRCCATLPSCIWRLANAPVWLNFNLKPELL